MKKPFIYREKSIEYFRNHFQNYFLYVIMVLLSNSLYAKDSKSKEKITINVKEVSLEAVLDLIETQTDFKFLYTDASIKYSSMVSLSVKNEEIHTVLKKLFHKDEVEYKFNGKIIILKGKKGALDSLKPLNNSLAKKTPQTKSVSGQITDVSGIPIPGASIIEKGTNNATTSDIDGRFSLILLSQNSVLSIAFVGYVTKEIQVGNNENIQVKLEENIADLDEVIVVGYGEQAKAKVATSISTIKAEELMSSPITSFEEGLAGQLAGVDIVQTSGDPGSRSNINIRGIGSLTANTQPLIVIDGFPSESINLKNISPSEIETIDILKDAAAAAIYGSRGANGIIIVTTKKGKRGPIKLTLDTYTGVQDVTKTIDLQNAYERAQYVSQVSLNSNRAPLAIYQPYLMGVAGLTNTNWQDEVFRSAMVQEHVITASGGSDQVGFFVSGGFYDQDGVILGSKYNRMNYRINLNFNMSKKFRASFNIAPSFSNRNKVSDASHKDNGVILSALMANPIFGPYQQDGSLDLTSNMIRAANSNGEAPVENPVALALLNKDRRTEMGFLGGGFIEFMPIAGLSIKSYLGSDYSSSTRDAFSPDNVGSYSILVENKQATKFNSFVERKNYMIENTASYQKQIGDHSFKVLVGQSFQTEEYKSNGSSALLSQTVVTNNTITSYNPLYQEKWSLISYLSRVNYDYLDKYILTASIRTDGSSRFGENSKWGWFPSISAAWRIGQEGFIAHKKINELKLRASIGVIGNNGIPNYGSIPLLGNANYSTQSGLTPITSPNQNLSWEQTTTVNFGADVSLFKNRFNLIFDLYRATTNDLLLNVPVPAHSGNTTSLRNIGKVENKGLEISLSMPKIKLGAIRWNSSFNLSTNKNKVLELGPGQDQILTDYHITQVGKPLGSYYTYRQIGIFTTQEQIDNAPIHPESRLGDYMFEDLNKDGKITIADREITGKFFPDYMYGFTNSFKYRGFSFSFSLQGKQGYKIFNATNFFLRNLEGWSNGHAKINNYYTPENPNAEFAKPTKHAKTYESSDMMLENGSYLRMRKVSIGYTLQDSFTQKLLMEKIRIYMQATNLFTITGYSGYNPEVSSGNSNFNSLTITPGVDYGAYPNARTIVMGLNLSF